MAQEVVPAPLDDAARLQPGCVLRFRQGARVAVITEGKRRRILRAIAGYGIVAFALLQIVEPIMHGLHLPDRMLTFVVLALALAFPAVVAVSWSLDTLGRRLLPTAQSGAGAIAAPHRELLASPTRLALAAMVGAAIAVTIFWIAARGRMAALSIHPTLTQVTFAGGIEEYPAWSPHGKSILYVARVGQSRKVFRKDLESGKEEQLTRGPHDELQPAWSPDGTRVLFVRAQRPDQKLQPGDVFGEFDEGDVWQLDLRAGTEIAFVHNAFNPSYSPDGSRIAVDASWAGPRRIWVVDAGGHNPQQVTTDSSEQVAHVAPSWSPDGSKIVFQNIERTKFDVRVVNLETKQINSITNDYPADVRPAWSPLGKYVYFSSDRSGSMNLWRAAITADGALDGPLQQVTTGAGQDVEPAISRDGKLIAFTTLRQNADIWRLPVSPAKGLPTGDPEPLISTTREDSRGAWSPDGSSVAFNSDRGGDMNIWLYSLQDGSTRRLTSGRGGDFQPNWSPDGRAIAFFSSRSGSPSIWKLEVESGKLTRLTSNRAINANPFFSPDGGRIAFQSDQSGRTEVWTMKADGSGARQLTNVGVGGHFLRWTDADDSIVFRCTCGGKPATMIVPAAGGEPRQLVDQKGGAHISFSPDRSRIIDVVGHKVLWVSPIGGAVPEKVFEFADPSVRIDYPVWSPDGKWVLFDRLQPGEGDVWMMSNVE